MFKKFAVTASALALVAGVTLTSQATPAHAAKAGRSVSASPAALPPGAILGSALSQPRYVAPPPAYYPAPPAYYPAPAPAPVIYRPAPWSPAWYNYCSRKYRSFNPNTGYFLSYSGQYRFCQ